ncbi:MAG: DsrE family protein [Clostridium sp.]|uniref:DsrE family protein n=1 Tax=Clostridium sp. TaxID=1506 RepID=UPI0039EBC98F
MSENKVIFHIDEFDKWNLLLKDVSILLDALSNDKFYIEVLATSEAVKFYDVNEILNTDVNFMRNLNDRGIKFVACNNSLTACHIKNNDIINFVDIVSIGTLELINKQSEGYIYLKAW